MKFNRAAEVPSPTGGVDAVRGDNTDWEGRVELVE